MNKKELENEIMKTQEQLEALQKKLKEAEDEVPETLDINNGDKFWAVDGGGNICMTWYEGWLSYDIGRVRNHRAFLSKEYAEAFAQKTQFIADLLHFKYLYDQDYVPDWSDFHEEKWFVYYDNDAHKYYKEARHSLCDPTNICFRTEEIAKKCVDWLNKKYDHNGYIKEQN